MTETSFWHPFANMGKLRDGALTIVRGEGSTVYDDTGKAYLDAIASLWYCNIGHGRAEVADAAAKQMRELAAYQTFELYTSPAAEELASRVAAIAPLPNAKVFFTAGGSDAVDTAGKLARAYWTATGHPEKRVIVSRQFAYHGVNAYGTSLGGIPANAASFGQLVPDVAQVAWDDAEALASTLESVGPDRVAAFISEPVVGAGGVLPPPSGYLERVQEICRANDVLFIVDEVITGFGRLGEWFATSRYGLSPDLITCAKGLTSGYAPLGAVIAGERVQEPFWARDTTELFRHGYTYSGHTAACAVGVANLDIIEREGLVARVAELEPVLAAALRPLAEHELVGEVRGAGLLGAVEFRADLLQEDAGLPARVAADARARGVLTRVVRGVALQVSPPFVITEDEIATIGRVFGKSLDAA
jgi:adenosylmethionine-8-amino-7-oxononanoate aminotransferase